MAKNLWRSDETTLFVHLRSAAEKFLPRIPLLQIGAYKIYYKACILLYI